MMRADRCESGFLTARSYTAYGGREPWDDAAMTGYGGQVEETGFGTYLPGHRPYLPALRRFARSDPLSPFDAGGINRYAYCGGDPINRIDPQGGMSLSWLSGVVGHVDDAAANAWSVTMAAVVGRGADALAGALDIFASGRHRLNPGQVGRSTGPFGLIAGKYHERRLDLGHGRVVSLYTFGSSAVGTITRVERRFSQAFHPGSTKPAPYIRPEWRSVPTEAGGRVYLPDAKVTRRDIVDLVGKLVGTQGVPEKDISILYGVHGQIGGRGNWAKSSPGHLRRAGEDERLVQQIEKAWPLIEHAADKRRVVKHTIGGLTPEELYSRMNTAELVIYTACYGTSDPEVMRMFNLTSVDVFVLV